MTPNDLDVGAFNGLDGRIKVIADRLTLWQGAQLAFDTTLVSPLRRDGTSRKPQGAPAWKRGAGKRPRARSW